MTLVAPRPAGAFDEVSPVSIDVVDRGRHLEIAGRLDSGTAYTVRRALDEAILVGEGDLVVDVRLAEIHDSTGLGLVLGAHRRADLAGRRLLIVNPSERFERLVRAAQHGRGHHHRSR